MDGFTKRETFLHFLLTSISILLIGSLPYLLFNMKAQVEVLKMIHMKTLDNTLFLYDTIVFNFQEYTLHIYQTIKLLFTGGDAEYYYRGVYRPIFPELWELFLKSMTYMILGLFFGLLLALVMTFLVMYFSRKYRALPKIILFFLESLPDIFIILIIQISIIWTYKKTGLLVFDITSTADGDPVVVPIFILSLLPAIYMNKLLLLAFEEEESRQYVEFAFSKGFSKSYILIIHILRNSILTFFNHFRSIFTFLLANLLMLEIIFNINGFMTFVYKHSVLNPEILTISLFMVFIPFFLIFTIVQWTIHRSFPSGRSTL
ncbi:ABC transporter permease subunit [Halobacillus yeomjeoni]|uniref:ABC transporter permease subunit n=1 Tax=Halobacillus yeomjeoni TaxID=311194 RepID=UPI001CD1E494|nr:ABC transporter permease subunit [Halobacillus yeomjeoni]MCA0982917.1 ABC transporter permease subunit [Halobacillus yeomjeoni]